MARGGGAMKRVLIVDDERDVTEALAELLEPTYAVSMAFNGAEALAILEAGGIDAVVLDLMMPVMNGETLVAELQARGMRVPVIFASASHDLPHRARRSKVDDYIAKPFEPVVLEEKLVKLLGRSGPGGSSSPAGSRSSDGSGDAQGGQDASGVPTRSRPRRSAALRAATRS